MNLKRSIVILLSLAKIVQGKCWHPGIGFICLKKLGADAAACVLYSFALTQEAESEESNLRGSPSVAVVEYDADARGLRELKRTRRNRCGRNGERCHPDPPEMTVEECFQHCEDAHGDSGGGCRCCGKKRFSPRCVQENLFNRNLKRNKHQKRQDQRDRRRHDTNPGRTDYEECQERCRKHRHGKTRTAAADPYELGTGSGQIDYPVFREDEREWRCIWSGGTKSCGYFALDWDGSDNLRDYDWLHEYDYGWEIP